MLESAQEGTMLANEDVRVNMLKPEEIIRKSTHFSRFDHSIVVIEINKLKITTSLEQALAILEKFL